MAFGVKTDIESGRPVDNDRIYRELDRPAVERAGLELARAVLTANVMVADVSGGNANVFYELGIRPAL